jgi:hypothetical protein
VAGRDGVVGRKIRNELTRTRTSRSATRASWAGRRRCRTWRACGLSWLRMCVCVCFFCFEMGRG